MQHPNDRGLDTYTYMYMYTCIHVCILCPLITHVCICIYTHVFINMGFPGGSEVKVSAMHLCTSRE